MAMVWSSCKGSLNPCSNIAYHADAIIELCKLYGLFVIQTESSRLKYHFDSQGYSVSVSRVRKIFSFALVCCVRFRTVVKKFHC